MAIRLCGRFGCIATMGSLCYLYLNSWDFYTANNAKQARDEVVLLLSGKRFAGKDFICNKIENKLTENNITYKRLFLEAIE